ncbi:MalY/PatB family protein [Nocardiopsis chromatogenes]|uniref:MalY/PatB family protein n=1 Tax=Nocardiopsis chromatogenes TaxID=280239 RepID=UPI00034C546D|nr:aminotransferase class I/II-fold pyridoxal phosphate-dependent enzyme [Nocardiopsis chromatogenes]
MGLAEGFDALTVGDLRARGTLKWSKYGEDVLGAFVAEMDFGTAEPVLQALREALEGAAFGYPPPGADAELAEACRGWQEKAYGWSVPAERIHTVPDVLRAFEIATTHFSRPGSPVILPTPCYMPFLTVPGRLGRDIIQVPMVQGEDGWRLDPDALAGAFRSGGHLLVLCNPHNPLGRVFSPRELAGVAEVVDRYGGRVFADEVHAPLTYPGHDHVPYASIGPTAAEHSVTATSASKAWNIPGLKCAQLIITNDADAEVVQGMEPFALHGASVLGMAANTAAYRHGAPWLAEVLEYLDGNRRALGGLLAEHLPDAGYRPPEGTYLAWIDLRGVVPEDDPAGRIRERGGVAVVDGAECGEAGRGWVRLNFATPRPVLERIVLGMARAARAR